MHSYLKRELKRKIREATNQYIPEKQFNSYIVDVLVASPNKYARRFDPPNYYPTVKALIDGLTDQGFWKDDSYKFLKKMGFEYNGKSEYDSDYEFTLIITEIE